MAEEQRGERGRWVSEVSGWWLEWAELSVKKRQFWKSEVWEVNRGPAALSQQLLSLENRDPLIFGQILEHYGEGVVDDNTSCTCLKWLCYTTDVAWASCMFLVNPIPGTCRQPSSTLCKLKQKIELQRSRKLLFIELCRTVLLIRRTVPNMHKSCPNIFLADINRENEKCAVLLPVEQRFMAYW